MKPIQFKGCEHYHVNNEGVVVNTKTGRVLKTDLTSVKYKRVTLWSVDQKAIRISVHRLVAIHYVDNPDSLPFVNHKDGVKFNNHHTNLEWCTCKENTLHAFKTGLRKCHNKSLSDELAKEIYDKWVNKTHSRVELIKLYKIRKSVIDGLLYRPNTYSQVK